MNNLQLARKEMGLSQQALANAVGTSKTHLQRLEYGARVPTVFLAIRIAKTLGKAVEDIFFENLSKKH